MAQSGLFNKQDFWRIFPIADVASARLMKVKARCLRAAGIVSPEIEAQVDRAADEMIVSTSVDRPIIHGACGSRHHVSGR